MPGAVADVRGAAIEVVLARTALRLALVNRRLAHLARRAISAFAGDSLRAHYFRADTAAFNALRALIVRLARSRIASVRRTRAALTIVAAAVLAARVAVLA